MADLITIGETMACFTPGTSGSLRYVHDYRPCITGAESNLAIGVQKLGVSAGWISKLGDDEFGHYIHNTIRGEGVDTRGTIFTGESPTGIMFKEFHAQDTYVNYYRQGSAASTLSPSDIPLASLAGCRILHLTGITPVLSESCLKTTEYLIDLAENNHIALSFDPNIRKKLWGRKDYSEIIKKMLLRSQIALLGVSEADILLGTTDIPRMMDLLFSSDALHYVAVKDGKNGAWVADRKECLYIPPHPCTCVDPIGAGDAFNAGFLSGMLRGKSLKLCGQLGGIAGALATESRGDYEGYPSLTAIEQLLNHIPMVSR